MTTLLIVDDDVASCRTLQLHFENNGHTVFIAHDVDSGLSLARQHRVGAVILDIRMPGRSGLEGLPEFKQISGELPVIMITAYHDMDSTIQAMKNGADDYIHKPVDIDELDSAVGHVLARARATANGLVVGTEPLSKPNLNTMVGRSRAMKEIFKTIGLVAQNTMTVSISGESGTGKELVARAIHNCSHGENRPFVAVNCAALVDTLLETELFGHEKGAFTGAVGRQSGKFALAEGGTIFLDEIGELSPTIQAKMLRVLQEKEYVPVGGTEPVVTNARVIAATNALLKDKVAAGRYREDLFYRLQVITIEMPPLRERMEDLPLLIEALLARINRNMKQKVTRISADVLEALEGYHWPGNVRELENTLMKAVALCPAQILTLDLLPAEIVECISTSKSLAVDQRVPESLSLDEVEREHVIRVLDAMNWHRGNACKILGISRPRLRRMMRQHRIQTPGSVTGHD